MRRLRVMSLQDDCARFCALVRGRRRRRSKLPAFDETRRRWVAATKVLGHPQVIDADGAATCSMVRTMLFVGVHPLAGRTWTWEMVCRMRMWKAEQRIFHLAVGGIRLQARTSPEERMLFEILIRDGQWCLDSFATSGGQRLPLLNCDKRYPFGRWYRVTTVYDGKMLKNYVGDELQGEGEVH